MNIVAHDLTNSAALAKAKKEMARRGIGVNALAEKVDVCHGHLSDVFSGRSNPSVALLMKITDELSIDRSLILVPYPGPGRVADIELPAQYRPGPGRGHEGEPAGKPAPSEGEGGQPRALKEARRELRAVTKHARHVIKRAVKRRRLKPRKPPSKPDGTH